MEVRPVKARITIRIERNEGPPIEKTITLDESVSANLIGGTAWVKTYQIADGEREEAIDLRRSRIALLASRYRHRIGEAVDNMLYETLLREAGLEP